MTYQPAPNTKFLTVPRPSPGVLAVRTFAQSEVGWKAKVISAALVLLLCAANALNVVNSYVGRNFMTAIADRDMPASSSRVSPMSASSPP